MKSQKTDFSSFSFSKIVDVGLRLSILVFLIAWCIHILKPFILILIWAFIISIAINPVHRIFVRLFHGKKMFASILLILCMIVLLGFPALLVVQSLFEGMKHVNDLYQAGQPIIPPPGAGTAAWPKITQPVVNFWRLASENLQNVINQYPAQVKTGGKWLFKLLAGIGKGGVQLIISLVISCVLLTYNESISLFAKKILVKLAGKDGDQYGRMIVTTILNVIKGVFGVSFIQSAMVAAGLFVAGVPFAGLWTVISLILAVIQVGILPVIIPVIIYMYSVSDFVTATLLAIWLIVTFIVANILTPVFMGRGAMVPMLVISLGSVGGFICNGFLGLFLGAVILSIGYKLFLAWLNPEIPE